MRANKVYLGLSLTTTILRRGENTPSDSLVFDFWPGGSVLHGWDFLRQCIDRLPIGVNDPNTISALGGTPVELSLEGELLGTENDYEFKVTCEGRVRIQRDWIAELAGKKWYVSGGWCSLFRKLIAQDRMTTKAFFGDLRSVDVQRKTLYILPHGLVKYGNIINSLPLEYIINKIVYPGTHHRFPAKYVTMYVTVAIVRGDYEPRIWFLGKRRFVSSAIVTLPLKLLYPQLNLGKENLTLAYAFVPQLMGKLNPDARQKVMADFKRLGLDMRNSLFIRSHFERYGYLGQREGVDDVINTLADYGVECVGRLGTWRELGINEILAEYSSLLK